MFRSRAQRIRKKLKSRSSRPRLSVFVSGKHIYAQVIDDAKGKTLAAARDTELKKIGKNIEIAREIGLTVAKKALENDVKKVVFDRGGRKYHGRIKALAEGAREGGLKF